MGSIALPPSGSIYLDANALIYSVETHATDRPLFNSAYVARAILQCEAR